MLLVAGAPAARLLAQIHDELLFEVPEAQVGTTAAVVRHIMEGRAPPTTVCSAQLLPIFQLRQCPCVVQPCTLAHALTACSA